MSMTNLMSQTGDVLRHLRSVDFPECTQAALTYLVHVESVTPTGFDITTQVASDFILFSSTMTPHKKLDSIQELNLLMILNNFFAKLQQTNRLAVFNMVFGGKLDDMKVNIFNKLTSLAISLKSKELLHCSSLWLQHHGPQSRPATDLGHCLIHDFCLLHKDINENVVHLPDICIPLCINLMMVFTNMFYCKDKESLPPSKLIEYTTHWLNHPNVVPMIPDSLQTPLMGLISWSLSCPVLIGNTETLSKYHLAVLSSITKCKGTLFNIQDIDSLCVHILQLCKNTQNNDILHSTVEQFAQILQILLASQILICQRDELVKILWKLPPNRILDIVLTSFTNL